MMAEKKPVEKSVLLLKQDFADGLKVLIDNSKLPVFIITPVLADVFNQLKTIEQQQYQEELLKYNEAIKGEQKDGSE